MKKFIFTLKTLLKIELIKEKKQKQIIKNISNRIEERKKDKEKLISKTKDITDSEYAHVGVYVPIYNLREDREYSSELYEKVKAIDVEILDYKSKKEKEIEKLKKIMDRIKNLNEKEEKEKKDFMSKVEKEAEKEIFEFVSRKYL